MKHETYAKAKQSRVLAELKPKVAKVDKAYIERKRQILFERELAEIEQKMVSYDY